MIEQPGTIVLMGSGELTATMVEVHKELLASLPPSPPAVFLDTPAGFQLNVDHLSQKAVDFFTARVKHPLSIASYKSGETTSPYDAERAFHMLREARFVLIGPGSPTYAVRELQKTPIPDILSDMIKQGGCLVAASAAALTVGRSTLPVYEIYKVGSELHWMEGMDILGRFGINCVVVPHWNNAEGGTHDTRFCYMGEPRFKQLAGMLPEDVSVLGLDEHTACIINLAKKEVVIRGVGRMTLQRGNAEITFTKGDCFALDVLRGADDGAAWHQTPYAQNDADDETAEEQSPFWEKIHAIEQSFHTGLDRHAQEQMTSALLDLDAVIWKAHQEGEHDEFISQAREILRDMVALIGARLAEAPQSTGPCLAPVLEELLKLRSLFRDEKKWSEADALRDSLARANILIEDTRQGPRWQLKKT